MFFGGKYGDFTFESDGPNIQSGDTDRLTAFVKSMQHFQPEISSNNLPIHLRSHFS